MKRCHKNPYSIRTLEAHFAIELVNTKAAKKFGTAESTARHLKQLYHEKLK